MKSLSSPFHRLVKWTALGTGIITLLLVGPPVLYLGYVWWQDAKAALPDPSAGRSDFSRLESANPTEVLAISHDPAEAVRQLVEVIARANRQRLKISISGAKHSMGGHTLYPGGIALDMLPFNRMSLNEQTRTLEVGAGAKWSEVIPFLDRHGLAVAVMQSNDDFSVGGSLSVNCHGWEPDAPPIASTVESFRLITAAGKIVTCSRSENRDLFSLALGGYGLFGVILDVRLRVVPNEYFRASFVELLATGYTDAYRKRVENDPSIGLAFGRICVAPSGFLDDTLLVTLHRFEDARATSNTLTQVPPRILERLLFRGSVGSDYGKNLCSLAERWEGGAPLGSNSRNQIMATPSDWFTTRDPASTEILHEYFIPPDRLSDFLRLIRPILRAQKVDLLNITVRKVRADHDTQLAYARQNMLGLVMFFHESRSAAADALMANCTRQMIDAALICGGTYYLPYRRAATVAQFYRAYPQVHDFFEAKLRYDPNEIFQNEFYLRYGRPGNSPSSPHANTK